MLIKICGITNIEEIKVLNILKPDYIGFIFAESKRKIIKERALELYEVLNKNIRVVGVFRNNSEEYIREVLRYLPLDVIQLHGREDDKFIRSLKKEYDCEVWKAISVNSDEEIGLAINCCADVLLFDSSNPGSGEIFPWELFKGVNIDRRFFLAGGINEENVLDGIRIVNPTGVDVSSGVEIIDELGKRVKGKEKVERFIRKVRDNYAREI